MKREKSMDVSIITVKEVSDISVAIDLVKKWAQRSGGKRIKPLIACH